MSYKAEHENCIEAIPDVVAQISWPAAREHRIDAESVSLSVANTCPSAACLVWTKDPDCGAQPYSEEASTFTQSRLGGQQVELEFDVEKTARYGPGLGFVSPAVNYDYSPTA